MGKRFKRQYHFDNPEGAVVECDEKGWAVDADVFEYPGDLYIETMDMWNCEDFSMELLDWCENAKVGDVFEDDDIRVTVVDD